MGECIVDRILFHCCLKREGWHVQACLMKEHLPSKALLGSAGGTGCFCAEGPLPDSRAGMQLHQWLPTAARAKGPTSTVRDPALQGGLRAGSTASAVLEHEPADLGLLLACVLLEQCCWLAEQHGEPRV